MDTSPSRDHVILTDATARYGRGPAVFEDADLRLRGPGLTLLRGPNGAGKSTLVEVISGYLPLSTGTATVNGLPASSPAAHERRRICRTEPALYPMMSVRDHLVFASRWACSDSADALRRAEDYGLGPWLDEPAETLSTGNRRRLWIVQCTVGEFDLLVMDEPFNGLDDASRTRLLGELAYWAKNRCIMLIAHQPPSGLAVDREVLWDPCRRAAAA